MKEVSKVREKEQVNFKLNEGMYVLFDEIREDFTKDYLEGKIYTKELREKYGLSQSEYRELTYEIKKEYGLNRRPSLVWGKHYYPHGDGFVVKKRIDDKLYHIAYVDEEKDAKEIVRKCNEVGWDIIECRKIVNEYFGNPSCNSCL